LKDEKMKKYFTNSKPVSRTVAPAGEDLEFTPAPAQTKSASVSVDLDMDFDSTPAPAPVKTATKAADDLDDLFADL